MKKKNIDEWYLGDGAIVSGTNYSIFYGNNLDWYYFFIKEGHYYNRFETKMPNLNKIFRSRQFDDKIIVISDGKQNVEYTFNKSLIKEINDYTWKCPDRQLNLCDCYIFTRKYVKLSSEGNEYFTKGYYNNNFITRGYQNILEALFAPSNRVENALLYYGQKLDVNGNNDHILYDSYTNNWFCGITNKFAFPIQPYIYSDGTIGNSLLIDTVNEEDKTWKYKNQYNIYNNRKDFYYQEIKKKINFKNYIIDGTLREFYTTYGNADSIHVPFYKSWINYLENKFISKNEYKNKSYISLKDIYKSAYDDINSGVISWSEFAFAEALDSIINTAVKAAWNDYKFILVYGDFLNFVIREFVPNHISTIEIDFERHKFGDWSLPYYLDDVEFFPDQPFTKDFKFTF